MNECLKQLMMSLLRAYRFSPIIPDLGFQVETVVLHLSCGLVLDPAQFFLLFLCCV